MFKSNYASYAKLILSCFKINTFYDLVSANGFALEEG